MPWCKRDSWTACHEKTHVFWNWEYYDSRIFQNIPDATPAIKALLSLYYGSITALLSLYYGSIKALLSLYYGSIKALLSLYYGSIKALLSLYYGSINPDATPPVLAAIPLRFGPVHHLYQLCKYFGHRLLNIRCKYRWVFLRCSSFDLKVILL